MESEGDERDILVLVVVTLFWDWDAWDGDRVVDMIVDDRTTIRTERQLLAAINSTRLRIVAKRQATRWFEVVYR